MSLCLSVLMVALAQANTRVYQELPIQEVTAFKDGHAFVLHEGLAVRDAQGRVVLDGLPSALLGTFWAYSAESDITLASVVAGEQTVDVNDPAVTLVDLIKANTQQEVLVKEHETKEPYRATILRLLDDKDAQTPEPSDPILLLRTEEGTKVVKVSRIQRLVFLQEPQDQVIRTQEKGVMTLQLAGYERDSKDSARVGMTYVQKGFRWIPSYRVEVDGQGKALVKLQATLVNDLADLHDVTVRLVVGVPRFIMTDSPDPISLQRAFAQVMTQARRGNLANPRFYLNAIQTQQVAFDNGWQSPMEDSLPSVVGQGQQCEDHFIYTIDHVSLAQDQRMVVPLAQFELDYEDVYVLTLPFSPPLELCRNLNSQQQLEMARMFKTPLPMHVLRLKNQSSYPLTTAPALILQDGLPLAQGLIRYTAIGNSCDLEVTQAVNVKVKQEDRQEEMAPNAVTWDHNQYAKISMGGSVVVLNYSSEPIRLEVKRQVLGFIDQAGQDGRFQQAGHGLGAWSEIGSLPEWWHWCSWPWWWMHFNSIGTAQWDFTLEPQQEQALDYQWHYFWRY